MGAPLAVCSISLTSSNPQSLPFLVAAFTAQLKRMPSLETEMHSLPDEPGMPSGCGKGGAKPLNLDNAPFSFF